MKSCLSSWKAVGKKMLKKIICLICCIFTLGGCTLPLTQQEENSQTILYEVVDATGTRLVFSSKPKRIVSMNVSCDEVLLDLVSADRLRALSYLSDDPGICSARDKVKTVKERVQSNNLEHIVALMPDLVFVPEYSVDVIRGLRSVGLKVYVLKMPTNLKEIGVLINEIGGATGDAQAAQQMVAGLQQNLEQLRSRIISQVPENKRLRVLALSFTGPLGMKGTFNDLCYYAGVRNGLDNIDIPYQGNLSDEKMLELNPDLIITPSWDYSHKGNPDDFRRKIMQNPLYASVNAVKNNRVVMMHDNYLYSTSQYVELAVQELAKAAYPQINI